MVEDPSPLSTPHPIAPDCKTLRFRKHFWEVVHDDVPDNVRINVQIPVRSDIATINHLAPFEVRMPRLEVWRELASRITKDPKTPQDCILNMPLPKNASFADPSPT
jgi:hypothetical protein